MVFSAGLGSTGLAAVGAGGVDVVDVTGVGAGGVDVVGVTGVGAGGRIGVVGSKFVKYVFTSWRCAYSRTTTLRWSAFFPFARFRPWPKATWNIASKVLDGILDEDDSQIALNAATTYKIKSTNENCYQVRKDNKVHLDF